MNAIPPETDQTLENHPEDQDWKSVLKDLEPDSEAYKRLMDIALRSYSQELEFLWKRFNFFWLLTAVALTAFFGLQTINSSLTLAISCVGFMASFSWTLLNRGSKYWYESWESKILHDKTLGGWFKPAVAQDKPGWWLKGRRFSPSKLAVGVSDYVTLFWLGALIFQALEILFHGKQHWESIRGWTPLALIVFTFFYAVFLAYSSAYSGVLSKWWNDFWLWLKDLTRKEYMSFIIVLSFTFTLPFMVLAFISFALIVIVGKILAGFSKP